MSADPGQDHIVIVGPSKSGTTGLYETVKSSLAAAGHEYLTLFEPRRAAAVDSPFAFAPTSPLLVKVTIDHVDTVLPDPRVFDRRVTTVRDPRDTLISTLLFRPLTKSALKRTDEAGMRKFVRCIRRKEADPSSASVVELFNLERRLGIGRPPYEAMRADLRRQLELIERHEFHIVRYEDFVAGELSGVGSYLGLDLAASTGQASTTYGHIARSKESGAFRHWFRADDLEFYDDLFGEFIDAFGYPRDVALPDRQVLDPATGSAYLAERHRQRRERLATVAQARHSSRGSQSASATSADVLAELVDHAGNGDAPTCLRLAQLYVSGDLGTPDLEAALGWARRAAQAGLADGATLVVTVLGQLVAEGDADPARHRELRAWRVVTAPGEARAALLASGRMRLGSLLAEAAADPRHKAIPALRELVALWRRRRARRTVRRP